MSITIKTVGIVVREMPATLAFYRTLGLAIPRNVSFEENYDFETSGGLVLGFITEQLAKSADSKYVTPVGQSMNLQFECASPSEVDACYGTLTDAGYVGYAPPWDAFWGQRFARVTDPDGRIVNLYAQL